MVELKAKVGPKGQIVIPKGLRERYGIKEGGLVTLELTENGMLLRGRPSIEQVIKMLHEHRRMLKGKKLKSAKLGELQNTYLEMEFEEQQ